jgi:tRNA G10  N-methylase Trm11
VDVRGNFLLRFADSAVVKKSLREKGFYVFSRDLIKGAIFDFAHYFFFRRYSVASEGACCQYVGSHMSSHFLVFGTHPFLSLAEVKAVLGGRAPKLAKEMAVFEQEDWDGEALQRRLAGVTKLGDIIAELPTERITAAWLADELEARPRNKKIEFGLTVYGGTQRSREFLGRIALQLKKELKERGYSVRWVTGEKGDVTPAAVAKAKLTSEGYDIVIGLLEDRTVVGLTTHVQDADAWSHRDYDRPFRDAKTGMLPPKLARMMVNLGVKSEAHSSTVLDPFCGGGTVLMEAGLVGCSSMVGSDISEEQIEGSRRNLDWLVEQGILPRSLQEHVRLMTQPIEILDQVLQEPVNAIVTEGYLGRPLSGNEGEGEIMKIKGEVERLWQKTLPVLAKLHKTGGRLVCAWPVYALSHGTYAVDLTKEAQKFGYNPINILSGWVEKPPTLTYARPDQLVRRNIKIFEKT